MNGNPHNKDASLCDTLAKGTSGSHSACCCTGNKDACLSTGLCLALWGYGGDGLLWVSGCTDPTWQNPACPRFCVNNCESKRAMVMTHVNLPDNGRLVGIAGGG